MKQLTTGIVCVIAVGMLWCGLGKVSAAPPLFGAADGGNDSTDIGPNDIRPALYRNLWFSTEIGFTSGSSTGQFIRPISNGDLLSMHRCLVMTNYQLTRYLGIMPIVPDLGLDAVTLPWYWPIPTLDADGTGAAFCAIPASITPATDAVRRRQVLFSLEESVFSETLGPIGHGDLLSSAGAIVRTNWDMIRRFDPVLPCLCPAEPCPCYDMGLDAVDEGVMWNYCVGLLFSVEVDFWSDRLGRMVNHGDLLSELGYVYRTNAELMAAFRPYDPLTGISIVDRDFGLDAVWVSRYDEIWFSVEESFYDRDWGWVSDGDVLSDRGRVIYRNLDLVRRCSPLEDVANFGLDALERHPWLTAQSVDDITPVSVNGK